MRTYLLRVFVVIVLALAPVACRNAGPAVGAPGTDLKTFLDTADSHASAPEQRGQSGRLDAGDVHHTRYRGDLGTRHRGVHDRCHRFRQARGDLQRAERDTRTAAQAHRAQELADDGVAVGPEGGGRTGETGDVDGRRVRPRQVLSAAGRGQRGSLSRYRSDHPDPRQGSEPRPPPRSVGGLAHDLPTVQEGLRPVRRTSPTRARRSSGSPIPVSCGSRDTTCRRRTSPKELDRLWEQLRPLYLSLHTYVRAKLHAEVRRRRSCRRTDSGTSARQHLGAGLVERLRHRRAARRRPQACRSTTS